MVMSGAARFTLGGEAVDAGPGTLVLVRPGTHREAVATEPDTLVLAVGGPLDRGIEEIPSSAAIPFGRALLAAAHDRNEEALVALREAIARDPRLRAEAEREPLLSALLARLG